MGVTAITGGASAGLKGNYPVTITSGQAFGGLATARSSANPNTMIGCYGLVIAGSPATYWGYCQARDDAGVNAMCTTTNGDLVLQMSRLQGDMRVSFQWDLSTNSCTRVGLEAYSMMAPKVL